MPKLPVINVFDIDELENHVSPDTIYDIREYKGEIYIVTQHVAFKYEGEKQELNEWLEESMYEF
jgi:hypothetical protein